MADRFTGKGILVTGAAAADIRKAGGQAHSIALDVADFGQCERAVARTVGVFGKLDVAFNNAGMPSTISREFEDLTLEEWRRLPDLIRHHIRVNAVCPGMIRTAMVFLASADASYIVGALLSVDGGVIVQ